MNQLKNVATCTLAVALSALPLTLKAQSASAAAPASTPAPTATSGEDMDSVVLTPFEVVENSKGYYSANAMSGTRFNTKLEDLGSSLTVMTKEQMTDFGMLNINDIFDHVAGAEGTGSYTDYVMDRGGQLTDNVQMNPTGANRVRGISSANISFGNFETMGRMPIDPIIVDGVEISRGPNANVFGLGNSSGTVNQIPFSANVNKNSTKGDFRVDSYGGNRSSLNFNRVLIKGKLGLRVNGSTQNEAFIRRPSGVDTKRYNAAIKYQPFANTRISASYIHYGMKGNRPNFTPPRDYVTDWRAAGSPTWDPVNQLVHRNGITYGMSADGKSLTAGSSVPIISDSFVPFYFTRQGAIQSRSNIYVDQGIGVAYWSTNSAVNPTLASTSNSGIATPTTNGQTVRLMQTGLNLTGSASGLGSAVPGRYTDPSKILFTTTPTLSDKSIYDWSNVNLSSVNYLEDKVDMYMADIDQRFFQTDRQMITAQVSFLREDSTRFQRTPIGNSGMSGQSGQLFIDVNETNLDGSPNQFVGRPYIGVAEPLSRYMPQIWDTYRTQVAYKLDFSHDKGWTKWLGTHQASLYHEYKDRTNRVYATREVLTSNHAWTATGLSGFASNAARGNQSAVSQTNANGTTTTLIGSGANILRGYYHYYVGDNVGGNVDYAPASYSQGNYPFVWGGYTIDSKTKAVVPGSGKFTYDNATLSEIATTDGGGGPNNLKQYIKTTGGVVQSFFLDKNLVTTVGLRKDEVWSQRGFQPLSLTDNNTTYDFATNNQWRDWEMNEGKTKTYGGVFRPFRGFSAVKHNLEQSTGLKRFAFDILNGLSLTYNKSDNFIPQDPKVDLYLNKLPNVTGNGKDMGFWLNLFNDKLVIRYNQWETKQINARDGDANTIAQRALRLDLDVSSDNYQLWDRGSNWVALANGWDKTADADKIAQATYGMMKIDGARYAALLNNFRAGTIAATNDVTAKGTELEVNYNPSNYWTVAMSGTRTESITTNVSNSVQNWIDERMPVWMSIVDTNSNVANNVDTDKANWGWATTTDNPQRLWWLHSYNGSQTPEQNYKIFIKAPYSVIKQQEGKSKPSIRKYAWKFSTSYQLAGIFDNQFLKKFRVGTSVRWEDRGAVGYLLKDGSYEELDANRPVWDKQHWYVDGFLSYRTRLFDNKVGVTTQLNVRNIQESGRLQTIGVFPDGTPSAYRIVDPRQYILSVAFDF